MLNPLFNGISRLVGITQKAEPEQVKLTFSQMRIEILAGFTVALALVPEAIAFAFVAGVAPLVGLYAAFIVGLITAVFGGRPGMISGATGALAVVMVSLVSEHGVEYLFATVILMGIIQLVAGLFRLGKFIRMVPHPVMLGFVNGLAIVIALAQLQQFQVTDSNDNIVWMGGALLYQTIALVILTMFIIWMTPKITKMIPGPLVAIGIVTSLVIFGGVDVLRVGDMAIVAGGLPSFSIPDVPINFDMLKIIFPYAFILAAIGLIESLLTLNLVGDLTNKRGGASKECLAQGAANFVTGFFGGMGGCAMIGQSVINVKSGGRTRLAGITAAFFLLGFILFASDAIETIPLAALVGVMFMVVIGTFAWNSIQILLRVPRADAFVILLVTGVTVAQDLAVAVIVGVIISALVYAWNAARRIQASTRPSVRENSALVYDIRGPLFFGSTANFIELFDVDNDPDIIVLDFAESRIVDQSGLQAIQDITNKYAAVGKQIKLRHISRDCHRLLSRSGQIIINSDDDPEYGLAVDYQVRVGTMGRQH
jgi:SulP family sulfate permease